MWRLIHWVLEIPVALVLELRVEAPLNSVMFWYGLALTERRAMVHANQFVPKSGAA